MPVQNIDLSSGYNPADVPDGTYKVEIADVSKRHIENDRFTGEEKDVLDFDFKVTEGMEKETIIQKGFVTILLSPPEGGRQASNLYKIVSVIYQEPTEEELQSYREGGAEFINSLIGEELQVLVQDNKVKNFLPA